MPVPFPFRLPFRGADNTQGSSAQSDPNSSASSSGGVLLASSPWEPRPVTPQPKAARSKSAQPDHVNPAHVTQGTGKMNLADASRYFSSSSSKTAVDSPGQSTARPNGNGTSQAVTGRYVSVLDISAAKVPAPKVSALNVSVLHASVLNVSACYFSALFSSLPASIGSSTC
jgi:hypothetical protein